MIFGSKEELIFYKNHIPDIDKIIHFLEAGNFPVVGEWLSVSESTRVLRLKDYNRSSDLFEAHSGNFDLHFTISGVDRILFCLKGESIQTTAYDIEKDFALFSGTANKEVLVTSDNWVFIFPHELHRNRFEDDQTEKLVFKIKLKHG